MFGETSNQQENFLEKHVDNIRNRVIYYEMVTFGVVCPKVPVNVGRVKQGRRI